MDGQWQDIFCPGLFMFDYVPFRKTSTLSVFVYLLLACESRSRLFHRSKIMCMCFKIGRKFPGILKINELIILYNLLNDNDKIR